MAYTTTTIIIIIIIINIIIISIIIIDYTTQAITKLDHVTINIRLTYIAVMPLFSLIFPLSSLITD